jgi:processive 1,2-diacylglycerol beta-glucosyltransferase
VLIVALSVGGGHASAGRAVEAALRERQPSIDVRTIDLHEYAAPWFRVAYVSGYLFIIRHAPWLWAWLYRHPPKRGGTLPPWLLRRALRPFEKLVSDYRPDAILATQITASEAASSLRVRGLYHGATATIVTDFDANPVWRAPGIDCFFVPDEAVRDGLIGRGIAADRLEATGVPIRADFEQDFDVPALKERHGLRPHVPVVLLMGGSLGLGGMEKAVRELLATGRPLDLVVVAGTNQKLERRLARLPDHGDTRLKALGYIDYVPELMAVTDLFVSKPGGLSMTEAVTVGVPTLAIAPLAGQEVANARHLEAQGVVRSLSRDESLAEAAASLLDHADERRRLAAAARAYAKPRAARRIAERLLQLADHPEPRTT